MRRAKGRHLIVIVPGKPDESELIKLPDYVAAIPKYRMPHAEEQEEAVVGGADRDASAMDRTGGEV